MYARARARAITLIIYWLVLEGYSWKENASIDNQLLTKKVMFLSNFLAEIFGQFTKKQYLCSRFRAYCE